MTRRLMPDIGKLNFTQIGTMMTGEVKKVFKYAAVIYLNVVSRDVSDRSGKN
jgi:hypothetical protein